VVAALISIHNLTRTYQIGERPIPILRGIDLTIQEGECLSLMGPSGSGKTTLMHLIGCLDRPDGGSYHFQGQEVSHLDDDALARLRARHIGYVFQAFNLIPQMTLRENVELPLTYLDVPPRERRHRALAAIEQVGLAHREAHRPSELSGGENQRGAIARALIIEPALLLADEPTGSLDSRTGEEITELFLALNRKGLTVLIVTHDPLLAARTNRIVRLRDGRLVDHLPQEGGSAGDPATAPRAAGPGHPA
jgi:putative ABC transport system ATP-binding protein